MIDDNNKINNFYYNKSNLSDIVVDYVKEKIVRGEFKTGDKIIELEISKALNISRAPIREAFRVLNAQGILSFSPRKGNQILEITLDDFLEIFSIRITLENQILELINSKNLLTEEDFDNLYRIIDSMMSCNDSSSSKEDSLFTLNMLDIKFHSYLWKISKSKRRTQILEGLFYQLLIVMNKDTSTLGYFEEKALEHKRIVDALKNKDLESALIAFKLHMNQYIDATVSGYTVPSKSIKIYTDKN